MTVVDLDTRRRDKIGGSEAADACGVGWRSRIELWAIKTGKLPEPPESEAMKWGTLLEATIAAEVERRGYELLPCPDAEWKHDTLPWLVGHPDGFVDLDGYRGVLEIKTAGPWSGHDWHSDAGAPLAYLVQCQHYMALTGLDAALLACLVAGQRLEIRTVERDPRLIEQMLELEQDLLDHVRSDTPPDGDGSTSAEEAIRALHPEANGTTVRLMGDEWEAVKELKGRKEQLDTVKRQVAELQQRVELAMGDAEHAVSPFDTPAARFRTVVSKRFDTTAFKADHPALYDEYAVAKTTRRFTVG